MATTIAPGVIEIDTRLGGWDRVTAGYLVDGPAPVLVETGSQSSVPVLLAALDDLGMAADDLAGVAVTHIHLDHAGGVGDVAKAFPRATIRRTCSSRFESSSCGATGVSPATIAANASPSKGVT